MIQPARHLVVTGGAGFIGSSVCRLLAARGVDFTILDRVESPEYRDRFVEADICDLDALRASVAGDCLIHLAAVHRDDVHPQSLYEEVNVQGTRNLCMVAEEKGIDRIVFASSVAVYGFAPSGTGEDGKIAPFNEYGRTKYAAEKILREWHARAPSSRSLTIIRPTVVFGPGNRGNVYNLLHQIQSGLFVMVGDGQNKKSMAYVDNVAAFFVHVLDLNEGVQLYNYVDKPDYAMNDLVRLVRSKLKGKNDVGPRVPLAAGLTLGRLADGVARLSGRTLPVSHIRVLKFTTTTTFSSAAHAVPGFTAPVKLDQGLSNTLESEFLSPNENARVFFTE